MDQGACVNVTTGVEYEHRIGQKLETVRVIFSTTGMNPVIK